MIEQHLLTRIFSGNNLTASDMEKVLNSFTRVEFRKNEFLFKEGSILNHYYFLESGFIRSFIHDYAGNEVTTKFYSEPEIVIDWTSFMLRTPTQENFQANTNCVCWKLEFPAFQELFNTVEGFRESGRARFASSYFELKKHHLSVVSLTAKERYLLLIQEHPEILYNASLKHIATYLGITDTSLSRIRKEISR